jgi:hypothetical protein
MKTPDEMMNETPETDLIARISARRSRRSMLRGALLGAAGVTGVAAASAGVLSVLPRGVTAAHAAAAIKASSSCTDSVQTILNVATTAEQLAVTFYTNGIKDAQKLGIKGVNLNYLTNAVVEEQLHENLLLASGGVTLTSTFSFPYGEDTFDYLDKFVNTLDQLETAFESAYIAAIKELADQNQSALAELAGQIVTIEAEHRVIGRSILPTIMYPNNRAFTPVYVKSVGDAVNVLASEGYLSPKDGNSYTYAAVSTMDVHVEQKKPYVTPCS